MTVSLPAPPLLMVSIPKTPAVYQEFEGRGILLGFAA